MTEFLMCDDHEMPLLKIGAAEVCPYEYMEEQLGPLDEVTVTDLNLSPLSLVFSTGHMLPLLCSCCGEPLHYDHAAMAGQVQLVVKNIWGTVIRAKTMAIESFVREIIGTNLVLAWVDETEPQKIKVVLLDETGAEDLFVAEFEVHLSSLGRLQKPEPPDRPAAPISAKRTG